MVESATNQANANYVRIWQTVLQIPFGKVASYGQIADLAGLPGRARLVGKALGFSPNGSYLGQKLPWYRVINSQGKISFPVGSECFEQQKALLQQEDIVVIGAKVRLQDFGWQPDLAELLFKLEH